MIVKMYEQRDLEEIYSIVQECGESLFTNLPAVTRDNVIQELTRGGALFCIYTDRLYGFMTLNDINYQRRSAFIGNIAIKSGAPPFLGIESAKWLINYCFDVLNLNRVYGHTWADNERMDVFYRRLGAVHEGTEREHTYKNGEYVDLKIWGILRKEWQA